MDKGPDQDTRDDPDGLVEAIAENDSDDLYAPPDEVPEKTVRKPHDEAPDNSPEDLDLDSLDGAIEVLNEAKKELGLPIVDPLDARWSDEK